MSCTKTYSGTGIGLSRSFKVSKLPLIAGASNSKASHSDARNDDIKRKSEVVSAQQTVEDNIADRNKPLPISTLSFEALVKLRHFLLRSPSAIAKLRLVDIVGATDESGNISKPAVRKGKICASRGSTNGGGGGETIPCNLIDSFPFERCEIVATVVKRKDVYTTCRRWVQMKASVDSEKQKGKEVVRDVELVKEVVSLIFYEREVLPDSQTALEV